MTKFTVHHGHDIAQGYAQSVFLSLTLARKNWLIRYTAEVCSQVPDVPRSGQARLPGGGSSLGTRAAEETVHAVSTVLSLQSLLQLQLFQLLP